MTKSGNVETESEIIQCNIS